MPKLKPRKSLRKGKRQHDNEWKKKRWVLRQLIDRTGGRCEYCNETVHLGEMDDLRATVDHDIPASKGGLDMLINYRLACHKCNQEKDDMTSEEFFSFYGGRVVRSWEQTGLLSNCRTELERDKLKVVLENVTNMLLEDVDKGLVAKEKVETVAPLIFPAIARIFNNVSIDWSATDKLDDCTSTSFEVNWNITKGEKEWADAIRLDIEVEHIMIVSDIISDAINQMEPGMLIHSIYFDDGLNVVLNWR